MFQTAVVTLMEYIPTKHFELPSTDKEIHIY